MRSSESRSESRSESDIQNRIRLAATRLGARLFRNNVGVFRTDRGTTVRCGLCPGSSDLIGWTPRVIQPDDVGRTIAVFTAVEVKRPGSRLSTHQKQFIAAVIAAGGMAGKAASLEELQGIISGED